MSNLTIIGTVETVPGKREQVLTALKAHRIRCLRDEPDTLQFEILTSRDAETQILLYEVYRDDAAFEMHRNGPSIARFREETAGIIVGLHVTKCAFAE